MVGTWAHVWSTGLAAFLASLVEGVEALTVVLAVGSVRGWRSAWAGTLAALGLLLLSVLVLGPALTRIPLEGVQIGVGTLLLLFGLRWLRKAILRAAGVIALHDEAAAYARQTAALRQMGGQGAGWDRLAVATAFKITLLEGLEVVFIVVAVGAGGAGLLLPASLGALAALIAVVLLGILLHRPLASVPENTLKFAVGVLLSGFGTFWVGEGLGLGWPGADWAIPGLCIAYLVIALGVVPLCRARRRGRLSHMEDRGNIMRWIITILQEIIGLFIDDGPFALAILVWLGAAGLLLPRFEPVAGSAGLILFAGLAAIIVESVLRRAGR